MMGKYCERRSYVELIFTRRKKWIFFMNSSKIRAKILMLFNVDIALCIKENYHQKNILNVRLG